MWDLESGQLVLGPLTGHDGTVVMMAVGERHGQPVIISGSDDGRTVQVWDTEVERLATLRVELDHQPMSVTSIADQLVIGTTGELLRIDSLWIKERRSLDYRRQCRLNETMSPFHPGGDGFVTVW